MGANDYDIIGKVKSDWYYRAEGSLGQKGLLL